MTATIIRAATLEQGVPDGEVRRGASATRRRWRWPLGVLAAYLAIAVMVWARVWLGGHPAGSAVCGCGDPAQTIWSLRWVPYALGHGLNPLGSHAMFAPDGVNLLDNTSALLPALVLSPVTLLFGPIASFNVALTIAPALTAWCAYAAIRPFTDRKGAAFAGGLLYGFSPFVLTSSFVGHLQFAVLCFPPLVFMVLYEVLVRRTWSIRRSATWVAGLLVAQFFIGTEVLAVTLMVAAIGVALLAVAFRSSVRPTLAVALRPLLYGTGVAAVILAVPAWFLVAGPRHFTGVQHPGIAYSGITLLSIVDPGPASQPSSFGTFVGYSGPQGPAPLYLGITMVVLLVAGVVALRRVPLVRWCAAMTVITTLLAGGVVYGNDFLADPSWFAPWRLVERLPLVSEVGPSHLAAAAMVFIALLFAVILDRATNWGESWLVRRRLHWRGRPVPRWTVPVAVTVIGVVALAPIATAVGLPAVVQRVPEPPGFARVVDATPAGTTMLLYPFPSALNAEPLVWQARTGLKFKLVGGYGFAPGPGGGKLNAGNVLTPYGALASVDSGPNALPMRYLLQLSREEIDRSGATTTVVVPVGSVAQYSYGLAFYTALLGRAPTYDAGGDWVWRGPVTSHRTLTTTNDAVQLCADLGARPSRPLAVPACVLATAG